MMAEILLTPRELLYIAALLDAPEFIGLSDAFFGMDETEMRHEITVLQLSLAKKGYAEMDFDGGFALKNEVCEVVGVCAACDTLAVVDKNKTSRPQFRELYYASGGLIIKMDEKEGVKVLSPVSNKDILLELIIRDVEFRDSEVLLKNIRISNDVLADVSEQVDESDLSGGIKTLIENGCDELSAEAIVEGLTGGANYYAVAITAFEGTNEGTRSIMLIDTKFGIFRMIPISNDDTDIIQFDALKAGQAKAVLTDFIRTIFENQREV